MAIPHLECIVLPGLTCLRRTEPQRATQVIRLLSTHLLMAVTTAGGSTAALVSTTTGPPNCLVLASLNREEGCHLTQQPHTPLPLCSTPLPLPRFHRAICRAAHLHRTLHSMLSTPQTSLLHLGRFVTILRSARRLSSKPPNHRLQKPLQ